MSDLVTKHLTLQLDYYLRGQESSDSPPDQWPVEPKHTDELRVDVYPDDDSPSLPRALSSTRLQVHLTGSARALREIGKYLIAFADLETQGHNPHEHFEDVRNEDGQLVHLIIGRIEQP